MKASLVVHSYNEADALERLILSSLHAAAAFDEWVVLDHRSSDDTQVRLDRLEPLLARYGVRLKRLREGRDLSRELTFADVRARTIHAATNPIAALMDADFVLGIAFLATLRSAVTRFEHDAGLAVIKLPIPCIWDSLRTDSKGRVTRHGRVWYHSPSHRIMRVDSVTYEQTGAGGRWEKLVTTNPQRGRRARVANDGRVLISANVKPAERLELRQTMTFFMEDTMQGKVDGAWLERYEAGELRRMPEYPYRAGADLRGVPLNLARLTL